jgi:hypothetical protein
MLRLKMTFLVIDYDYDHDYMPQLQHHRIT